MAYTYDEIIKAFKNEEETVIPVSFWHHFAKSEFIDALTHPEVFDLNVNGHKHYVDEIDPDFVKTMTDGYFIDPATGGFSRKTVADLKAIKPLVDTNPWLTQQAELAEQQVQAAAGRPTFYTVFSPLTALKWTLIDHDTEALTVADERFADLYEEDPEAVRHALFSIGEDTKQLVAKLADTGLTGIYYSTQSIQDARVKTKTFFKDTIEPVDLDVITAINANFDLNILHVCGFDGATNDLEWFKDYPLQIINWATQVDGYTLGEGKRLFGGKPVLGGFGNESSELLYSGTKEAIQAEARKLVAEAGRRGVIIGADCTVPRDIPAEHIRWVQEAIHNL